ncbi:MAG TPA: ERF family protein [Actinomycetota bacterium]|nr:ERF family protein [Actinomycetota bacterium]
MKTSESTDKIALAYVAAWAELTNAPKDGKANYGTYTTLPALLDHIKGPLTANGIAVMQEAVTTELGVGCLTRLVHTSGQFYEFGPLTFPGGDTPQKGGSAETYARRYQLSAAVGVAADEDDDGAAASKTKKTPEPTQAQAGSGTGAAGATQESSPPASAAPQSSGDDMTIRGGASPEAGKGADPAGEDGTAPEAAATPEQRTRLLKLYKPSEVKAHAVELFARYEKPGDVLVGDLTAAEIEALILARASA